MWAGLGFCKDAAAAAAAGSVQEATRSDSSSGPGTVLRASQESAYFVLATTAPYFTVEEIGTEQLGTMSKIPQSVTDLNLGTLALESALFNYQAVCHSSSLDLTEKSENWL